MSLDRNRLEALNDGVIAIIMTIMVLDIQFPKSYSLEDLTLSLGSIFVYFSSFFIVGSFWYKHYRLFVYLKDIKNTLIFRNMLFLFTLSLIPVFTKWLVLKIW